MLCTNCGKTIQEGAGFCSECEANVAEKEPAQPVSNQRGKPKKALILICAVLVIVLGVGGFFLLGGNNGPEIGEIIQFGGYDWRVLDVDAQGRALIITENVIGQRAYHNTWTSVTWESSDIRRYLNGEFYNSFSELDRARIRETTVVNNNNPWFGTPGGNDTTDRIFLLSLEEVVRYFGDSGQLGNQNHNNNEWWGFRDQYSEYRIARDASGNPRWWWLCSPGIVDYYVAIVYSDGYVDVYGINMFSASVGVRPALWLNP